MRKEMKKIKERFEPNDILTLSSGFLARYAGSNKYDDIERFQNNLFIWVRDEVAKGRRFNSHIEALEAFIAERDEYRRTHNTYEIEVFESVKISQDDHDIILEKGDKIRVLREVQLFDTDLGITIKDVLRKFGFNNHEKILKTDFKDYQGTTVIGVYQYALALPSRIPYDVFSYLYKELKKRNFAVSELKDTRPGWDSMRFTVDYLGKEIKFIINGLGASYTPIMIGWK